MSLCCTDATSVADAPTVSVTFALSHHSAEMMLLFIKLLFCSDVN